jgi:predicted dehydrogenase
MENRRTFLKTTIGALGAAATGPLSAKARVQGANNRIRLAVIGCGNRSGRVFDSFARNSDAQWLAGCEVNPAKLQGFMTDARKTFNLQMVTDYRRILDRNDIDAVLIGTPDFSHAKITVDALAAGKDVYVEKPAANTVARINAMLDAYTETNRVVQIGTEQRSWDHFAEAKKILDSGVLGNIRHVAIVQPGSGLIEDGGADHVDIAHWFMSADHKIPRKTAAVGLCLNTQNPDPEQVPDTFSISWEYDNFVMTFANGEVPRPQDEIEGLGTFFIGSNGSLQVNRRGYALRPPVPRAIRTVGPLPLPAEGSVNLGASGRGGGTPVERNISINPRGVEDDYPLDVHVKNFLDCMRSREQSNANMEIGYHSALPCLLALESMEQNKVLGWDATARKSKVL